MVTNKRLIEVLRENSEARLGIVERKNSNYAGGGPDANAFKNFDMVEVLSNGRVTREMGMFVRMTDKLARLGTLMFGGVDNVGESVEDTLQDLANYADLTLVAVRDKNEPPLSLAEQFRRFQAEGMQNVASDPIDDNSPLRRHASPIPPDHIHPTSDPKSILSRFLNLGGTDRRAA